MAIRRSLDVRPILYPEVPEDSKSDGCCRAKYCKTPRQVERCPLFCEVHCCDYKPQHLSDFRKFFARNESRKRAYLRCSSDDCGDMRVRSCKMYCREHCCWGFHKKRRLALVRKHRRKCKEKLRAQKEIDRKLRSEDQKQDGNNDDASSSDSRGTI